MHSSQDGLAPAEFLRSADLGHGVRDFHNPYRFESECGFDKGYELRLVEMLKGVDLPQSAVGD